MTAVCTVLFVVATFGMFNALLQQLQEPLAGFADRDGLRVKTIFHGEVL